MEIPELDDDGNEVPGGGTNFCPILESVLEIHFSPMVVISKELVVDEEEIIENPETIDLNKQLEKALKDENYELASKIRDLIEIYKKQK
jgi:protein-arginine kinase activator protein McsA